ncbi:MAG: GTP-binding protein [Mariniblastus sp.]|nr:GTP-binding protein [Mariniblastus sp.]
MNSPSPSNVCSQITPIGRGAVAVVAVHGELAGATIDECLLTPNGNPLTSRKHQDVAYGIWKSTGEDLVVSKRGENHFEIHCHGGTTAIQAVIRSLSDKGFAEVSATEFATQFQDFWSVSTQLALTHATTSKTASFLLRLTTQLPKQIQQIRSYLTANERETAATHIQSMLRWANFGQHLTNPRTVVLCGQPNVGKSSLVNAMAGFQRAIVHDIPGTTRDVVSQALAIDGWPVTLKDTAGIRDSDDPIEIQGIAQAREQISKSDLTICVFDVNETQQAASAEFISQTEPDLIVLNKTDLLSPDQPFVLDSTEKLPTVNTSVKTNQGIRELLEIIGAELVSEIPSNNQTYPVTAEQQQRLEETLDCLNQNSTATLSQVLDRLR